MLRGKPPAHRHKAGKQQTLLVTYYSLLLSIPELSRKVSWDVSKWVVSF